MEELSCEGCEGLAAAEEAEGATRTYTLEDAREELMGSEIPPMTIPDDEDSEADSADSDDDQAAGRSFEEGDVGLGVDIVEVERMRSLLERTPSFAERVFSSEERAYCKSKSNPATHYALRFAAKEAVVKALGTGFAEGIGVRDIEVGRAKSGRPYVVLSGRARQVADEQGVRDISISLSYTHSDAVACALAITESSVRATEKRRDPMEELAKKFKETRGMLDDL